MIDCSGFPDTFTEALALVRTGGVVIKAGTFVDMGPVPVNPNSAICTRSVAVLGIGGEKASSYEPSMRMLAANLARYPLGEIVTHRFGLGEVAEALAVAQSGEAMQVVTRRRPRPGHSTDITAISGNGREHSIMTRRLRTGVVGTGIIAQVMHLHYLSELAGQFEVAAVCDLVPGSARACADQRYGPARSSPTGVT